MSFHTRFQPYIQVVGEGFWCILPDLGQTILVPQTLDGQGHPTDRVDVWLGQGAKGNPAKLVNNDFVQLATPDSEIFINHLKNILFQK